jgi:hypothetical protein
VSTELQYNCKHQDSDHRDGYDNKLCRRSPADSQAVPLQLVHVLHIA